MKTLKRFEKYFQIMSLAGLLLTTVHCSNGTALDPAADPSVSGDETGDTSGTTETPVTDEPVSESPTSDDSPTETPCEQVSSTYYADVDADGFGDASNTQSASACVGEETVPAGFVTDSTDCLDSDAGSHPGALEVLGDGIDQDCTGADKYLTQVVATNYAGDGVTLISVDTATLSAGNRLDLFVHDFLGDGLLTRRDYTTVYTYDDALGSELSVKTDGKGKCVLQTNKVTDANDVLTLEASDFKCNGFYEDQITYVNTYDANGDLTQRDLTISEDTNDDGVYDVVTPATRTFAYTYWDVDLTVVKTSTVLQDGVDYRYTEFDENGHATLNNVNDSDPLAGSYTESNVLTYDAVTGFLLTRVTDDLATAQTPDETQTFERDAFGAKTKETVTDSTGATIAVTEYSNTYSE